MVSELTDISTCCGGNFSRRCAPSWELQAMLVFGLVPRGHGLHVQKMNTSQEQSDFSQMVQSSSVRNQINLGVALLQEISR